MGEVRDPAGLPLDGGRVVLVPSTAVEGLAETPIDLSLPPAEAAASAVDEPLEDLLDSQGDSLASTNVVGGLYRFETVPDGQYFLLYEPAADDLHLPGGDPAVTPRAAEALRGSRIDLRVSGSPSADARYVGSTPCLTCHGRHETLATAHALTLRVPRRGGQLQDSSGAPRLDTAYDLFDAGVTLYFFGCDPARTELPVCQVSASPPADPDSVRFRAHIARDPAVALGGEGAYRVELELPDGSDSQSYPLRLSIGGVLSYQQYLTRQVLPGGGQTHRVLPFSHQLDGDDTRSSFGDWSWVDYRSVDWFDFDAGALREPPPDQAFDRQCAGCHVTGFELSGDAAGGFRGRAVADVNGVADLDGDGRLEQLGVGCESCHGPGSEHLAEAGERRGQRIVTPSSLLPGRRAMICGACHSNPRGVGGELPPLDGNGRMPRPGLRRQQFLASHVSRVDASAQDLFPSGDSRRGHQQYTDWVRSAKYRSAALLADCGSCHASHGTVGPAADLLVESDDDALCSGCHGAQSADLNAHANAETSYDHIRGVAQERLSCVACHMVKTAKGGARLPALLDTDPPDALRRYYHGDRTSHRFEFVGRDASEQQPVAATDACGQCHGSFFLSD